MTKADFRYIDIKCVFGNHYCLDLCLLLYFKIIHINSFWISFVAQLGKSQTTDVIQPDPLVTSQVGDTVTLQCFYETADPAYLSWYKQSGGWKPCLISTVYNYEGHPFFFDEFKSNSRLRVQVGTGKNHLIISNTQDSDSAMYYCGVTIINVLHFGNGTLLLTGTVIEWYLLEIRYIFLCYLYVNLT